MFDSTQETNKHKKRVKELLEDCSQKLFFRGILHDDSKLLSPEKQVFDEFTPKLKTSEYGSEEYKSFLNHPDMKMALKHHYEKNSHHPEHYENGIKGMNLIDLIEMICDWKASSERHQSGDLKKSIMFNQKRFGYSDELKDILLNTVEFLFGVK